VAGSTDQALIGRLFGSVIEPEQPRGHDRGADAWAGRSRESSGV